MDREQIDIKEIRELARRFTPEEIDACINRQILEGQNPCEVRGSTEYVLGELAKAEFVRKRMDDGMSLADAVRELARRIRLAQQNRK
ncbi:MAG TPA: hypothetical protein VLS90_14110 [Thermodesulfobacteriota bacterium]|nr:hypothetical protein [Thermodesulfobacteriota bacterium]